MFISLTLGARSIQKLVKIHNTHHIFYFVVLPYAYKIVKPEERFEVLAPFLKSCPTLINCHNICKSKNHTQAEQKKQNKYELFSLSVHIWVLSSLAQIRIKLQILAHHSNNSQKLLPKINTLLHLSLFFFEKLKNLDSR